MTWTVCLRACVRCVPEEQEVGGRTNASRASVEQSPPPPIGHFDKKASEIHGAEEFSLGHIGTAAVLVLPLCGPTPPPFAMRGGGVTS